MEQVIIKPSSKKEELIFVFSATVLILLFALISISLRKDASVSQKLKGYQINAFSDLKSNDQFIFTALYGAGYEIESYHMTNGETWPSVSDLERDAVSPFVKDRVWVENGRVGWIQRTSGDERMHQIAYLGVPGNSQIGGTFLLVLDHLHDYGGTYLKSTNKSEPFRIWYTPKVVRRFPSDFSAGYLIKDSWKEVVPYKGKDEAKRIGRGK